MFKRLMRKYSNGMPLWVPGGLIIRQLKVFVIGKQNKFQSKFLIKTMQMVFWCVNFGKIRA